ELKELLENSRNTVAVTGAGISFSAGGLNFDHSDTQGLMALGSEDMLRNEPEQYYKLLDQAFLHSMFVCGPSEAHKALARLEEEGKLSGIITTNIDCLHTIAGSKNVAEIQGSFQVNKCMDCGLHYDDYEIWNHGKVPECTECGGPIWLFPFYSHIGLDHEEVRHARKMIARADLILLIGTNGPYGNAYWSHRNRRAKVVQINPGATGFDSMADLNIRRDADSVFEEMFGAEEESKTD
ncbi:MAG: NAD-dependent deacetylase, partial [Oscillospiraceae bacterium]|nr:NAD-dependent deacetylase [Oscillospiraceae bacterium]